MTSEQPLPAAQTATAFVLGGGGLLGAAEVGMLRALLERGIRPNLVVGTSIGAINGAVLAHEPTLENIGRLTRLWTTIAESGPFAASISSRIGSLWRSSGVHAYPPDRLEALLSEQLPEDFEGLQVPFWCCAASIERSRETWFHSGALVPAVRASAALPGVFPPVEIGGEHYIDGGIVNSIPLDRARKLGAARAYVLQVGRIEQPLRPPSKPWQVAQVAFEIARRARFHAALKRTREFIDVYVLPTGGTAPAPTDWRNLDFRDTSRIDDRINAAYSASVDYLDRIDRGEVNPREDDESPAGRTAEDSGEDDSR